nr:MAG TPA: hypothetical protein [Caudoviricetes sp.]
MTDTNPTPENLAATLVEVSQQLEDLRGSTLDPSDPLNETSGHPWCAPDATNSEDERADNTISAWGAPRTIRNFLKALVSQKNADSWYTVRSLATRKRYRISRVDEVPSPATLNGYDFMQSRTHDFTLPVSLEELTAGWVYSGTAKVLDVFKLDDTTYAIYELLD